MNTDTSQCLNQGIAAAKAGDAAAAKELLLRVIEQDSHNEAAWLWLATVVESTEDRRVCLDNVLTLNPDNDNARAWLAMLDQAQADALVAAVPAAPPSVSAPQAVSDAPGRDEAAFASNEAAFASNEATFAFAQAVTACPYCGREVEPEETRERRCPHCRHRLLVERPAPSLQPGFMRFLSGSWILMALIYSVVNAIIVSIVLMVIGPGRPVVLGGDYATHLISSYVIDLAPRPGLSAERLAVFVQLLVAGEAIVTAWCVAVAAILPSRRIGAGLVAGFVIAVSAFLLVAELIFGMYASLVKLATLLAVSALLLRSLGEFRMETVRYTLSLDRGLTTSMDYYNRGRRYRDRGMLAQAILHWERAAALEPNRAPLRIALGNALYTAGRYREADEHIRTAVHLSPDNEDLRQFLERIQLKLSAGS